MKKCALIYNPNSGKQNFRCYLAQVIKKLGNSGFSTEVFVTTHSRDEVGEIAKRESEKVDLIIAVGGDGTLNEVVNGIMKGNKDVNLGYIPAGTTCDVGHTYYISKNVYRALKIITDGYYRKIDLVNANGIYFMYVLTTGAYVNISYETSSKLKRMFGPFAYVLKGIKSFFTVPKTYLKVETEDRVIEGRFSLALFINSRRVAGLKMIKKPKLDDGMIDIVLYRYVPFLNNLIYLVSFIITEASIKKIVRFKTKKLKITAGDEVVWNMDGEKGKYGNQEIEVFEKQINFIMPKKAIKKYFND